MLPQDPVMLLSVINMKLRDCYDSLETLCDDLDVSQDAIVEKLRTIDYVYDRELNQFKQESSFFELFSFLKGIC